MIASSALESDCRLLGRQCIICPSSESRGRVAGWSLWRFMAPSWALIASYSLGSLGRPTECCDQRGFCGGGGALTGGSDQNTIRWNPLRRQMVSGNAPQTDDQQRPRQKQQGDVWLLQRVGTLTWLSQKKREELWELWLNRWPSTVGKPSNEAERERNIWSHSIHFIMTSPSKK